MHPHSCSQLHAHVRVLLRRRDKGFFNQLKTHPATHWQSCLVTLPFNDVDAELVYVVENVLDVGVVCGSNAAQRLADALVWLFHKWFDEEEDALLGETQSADWQSWRASRAASCTQSARVAGRLYCIHICTDAVFAFMVGPNRQGCAIYTRVPLPPRNKPSFNLTHLSNTCADA